MLFLITQEHDFSDFRYFLVKILVSKNLLVFYAHYPKHCLCLATDIRCCTFTLAFVVLWFNSALGNVQWLSIGSMLLSISTETYTAVVFYSQNFVRLSCLCKWLIYPHYLNHCSCLLADMLMHVLLLR